MRTSVLALFFAALAAYGQAANPLSADTKMAWDQIKGNLVKAAEKMPEANYSFKPSPDVRSFGELVGHVANANYMICGAVHSTPGPKVNIEKTVTGKAELVKALNESVAYCDAAYAGLTDAAAAEKVKLFRGERTRLNVLTTNIAHDFEHYGNMVTYMRIKGLVPPSSEGR